MQHAPRSFTIVTPLPFIHLLCSVMLASEELGLPPRMNTAEVVGLIKECKAALELERGLSPQGPVNSNSGCRFSTLCLKVFSNDITISPSIQMQSDLLLVNLDLKHSSNVA